jgi:O-antigen/teichoic acid export membrane protein
VLITSIASMSMMLLTALAAPVVARALLPSAFASSALVTVAAAGCLTMASIQILSAVAALDRLRIYRRALLMQAVAGPCVAAISLRSRGVGALPGMILRMSIASVLIACVSLWVVRDAIERPCRGAVRAAAAMLARQGGLFTLAAVVGNGVVNVTPLLVARMAGHDAAGLYRAASVLSAGYLTVLTTALGREFLPRASRDGLDPPTLHRTLDAQVRLMSAVALPVVLTGFVAAPIAIRAVFGSEFGDAWHILAAQLPGDVLRIIGFTLVYGLIASTGARMVVVSEVVGGLALLGCVVAIVPTSGSVGIGVALTSAYAIYVPLAFLLLNRATGYRPSAQARNAVLGATAVAAAPALLLATMGPTAAEVVAGCLAVAAATALISTYSTNVPAPLRRLAGAAATEHTTGTRSRP